MRNENKEFNPGGFTEGDKEALGRIYSEAAKETGFIINSDGRRWKYTEYIDGRIVTGEEVEPLKMSEGFLQDLNERGTKAFNLPTEDEVYEEALRSRAGNTRRKLARLTSEINNEAESLVKKSEEAMRTKMELNVLMEELGEKVVGTLIEHDEYDVPMNFATEVDRTSKNLSYTGSDLLKAYAQLKAVFEIDGERVVRQQGVLVCGNITPKGGGDGEVVFPERFSTPGNIDIILSVTTESGAECSAKVYSIANYGFSFDLENHSSKDTGQIRVAWTATI